MTGATVGKIVAGLVFLGVAGLIGVSAVRTIAEKDRSATPAVQPLPAPTGDVTVVDLPQTDLTAASILGTVEGGWSWRHSEPDGRLRYEINADSLEPKEAGRIRLVKPRATFPIEGGRIEVHGAEATIVRRSDGEPESGDLTGGVTIAMLRDDPKAPGGARTTGTFSTSTLHFEESLNEASTEDDVAIDGDGIKFRGRGLTIRMGEFDRGNSFRPVLVRFHEGGRAEIEPDALDAQPKKHQGDRTGAGAGSGGPAAPPVESFYRVVAAQDVELHAGTTRVFGDRAELSVRLVDGALAPNAVKSLSAARTDETSSGQGAGESGTDPATPTVVMSWKGAMELRLVDERPADLAPELGDDASIRWVGVGRNPVLAEDTAHDLYSVASEIRYGLTSARLRLTGKQGMREVELRSQELGELRAAHVEVDLGALPQITAWVEGPGVVNPRAQPDGEPAEVAWDDRADLTAQRDAKGNVRVTSVSASERVRLAAKGWTLESAFARAVLTAREGRSELDRVILRDGFKAASPATSESVEGREAEIRFSRPEAGAMAGHPEFVAAKGNVRLAQGSMRLDGETLEAELTQDASGKPQVSSGEASGAVRVVVRPGVEVSGPQARVEDAGQTLGVNGPGSKVTLKNGAQTIEVKAESMEVRRGEGRVVVVGPGTAERRLAASGATEAELSTLSWTEGLLYDDTTGIAELLGAVEGHRRIELTQAQRLTASGGAVVSITPHVLGENAPAEPKVLSVVLDGRPGTPAEVEARWYAPPPPPTPPLAGADQPKPGALESMLALRSAQIALDLDRQRLSTPGAGVLVIEDRRGDDSPEPGPSDTHDMSMTARGTTAFRWNEAFTLDRLVGNASMTGGVRASHVDPKTQFLTELHAERLDATLIPPTNPDAGLSAEVASSILQRISARDHVTLEHRTLVVDCELLEFDAGANLFTARTVGDARVRALDRQAGATVIADEVSIDPSTGLWSVKGGTGITSGR